MQQRTFREDDAPQHYNVRVRQFLDMNINQRVGLAENNEWISVEWSERSSDPTLDFFVGIPKIKGFPQFL